jgi:dienelactone hydrolase
MDRFGWVCLVVAVLVAGSAFGARARDPGFDVLLREQVHDLAVPGPDVKIVMTSFRPRGDGPFPWIVLSHGTAPSREANRNMPRYRPLNPVREWVDRGYAVLVPVRRGYGPSGGASAGDDYGGCGKPDFRRAGEGAALDLLAAIEWARGQKDLDPARWLLVGQSAGGFASIYTASKRPPGLIAVLAFSPGRGGDPDKRPGEPCASQRLADLYKSIAPQINVPVLWFYAENDEYLNPRVQKLWFEHFRAGGGKGELVVVPPFPEARGHGVFPSAKGTPLWTDAVGKFFAAHNVAAPFAKR